MRQVLKEIQDGTFAEHWIDENQKGGAAFLEMRRKNADHQIEEVGTRLRSMMPWLEPADKG
jgi:ketol-acid reductoisomerase